MSFYYAQDVYSVVCHKKSDVHPKRIYIVILVDYYLYKLRKGEIKMNKPEINKPQMVGCVVEQAIGVATGPIWAACSAVAVAC